VTENTADAVAAALAAAATAPPETWRAGFDRWAWHHVSADASYRHVALLAYAAGRRSVAD